MAERYLIIVAEFNELITKSLLSGAEAKFHELGKSQLKIVFVPGAFDIPVAAAVAARSGDFSAVVCLGAVVKGDTPHFDYVAGQCAAGLMKVGVDTGVPIVFGVLTTNTIEEALNRAGLKMGNKGREAAETAVRMVAVTRDLAHSDKGGSR